MTAILINRAKANDQVSGIVPILVDSGLSILEYTDDTVLCVKLYDGYDDDNGKACQINICNYNYL